MENKNRSKQIINKIIISINVFHFVFIVILFGMLEISSKYIISIANSFFFSDFTIMLMLILLFFVVIPVYFYKKISKDIKYVFIIISVLNGVVSIFFRYYLLTYLH
ncbi:ABC-type transport system involved in cytochrome bd biosynthesis fused ATPase/permease subunit [Aureibacter tunicatorum]|uniref:ABC-type transport system involved in cytochrome bd biosynthesis fused ATPase/permease subunit n=1 Tax=Aureibacter tunicatorum TaxID=866807 RepID=A0AAE4BUA9_9BACT|nr:ABC-type transport system involved in cytochrome bd biosynthesis fused ATPase/permease subunit [Aureibacter tunicatorum]BDD06801.1 hypothetical protein AUTU_42840 [Aureibacter tunicatorum]